MTVEKVDFQGVLPVTNHASNSRQMYYKPDIQEIKDEDKRNASKYMKGAAALAVIALAGIICHKTGAFERLGQMFTGKASDVAEKTLANGKKVVKTVLENADGTKTVKMEVYSNGELLLTRTKTITSAANKANGKKYITVKKEDVRDIMTGNTVSNSTEINKYYDGQGNLLLKTNEYNDGNFKTKIRYNPKMKVAAQTYYRDIDKGINNGHIRSEKSRYVDDKYAGFEHFTGKGTKIKEANPEI